jgi:hypothetical protein
MSLTPSKAKEILERYFAQKMTNGSLVLPLVDEIIYSWHDENGIFSYSLKYCMKIYAQSDLSEQ